ncbi:hypothetical protein [Adonisia turfae]|nr:hypothetical protein [Adonisia turfae]
MQSPILELLIKQCDDDIVSFSQKRKANKECADLWGKTHISLGLLATISSSLGAIFTFLSNPMPGAILTVVGAIASGSLTSSSPHQREAKRREIAKDCDVYISEAEGIRIKARKLGSEEEIVEAYEILLDIKRNTLTKIHKLN